MRDQTKCDHKFVDSTSCLKCGWTPPTQISSDQAPGSDDVCCDIYRQEFIQQLDRADALQKLLEGERAATARFLVPYRSSLPDCWLEHFEKECGVYFDEIGFVHPRPIPPKLRGGMDGPNNQAEP